MWSVARATADGRVEYVKGFTPGGGIETTMEPSKAVRFMSLIAAQTLAKELSGRWYVHGWSE